MEYLLRWNLEIINIIHMSMLRSTNKHRKIVAPVDMITKRINVCVDRKRRLERKKLKQEEEKRDRKVSEESRRTMLEILQRMESAKAALENEETGKCDDDIEVIYFLLEQLPIKDENYMILKAHADLLAAEAGKPTRAVAA